MSVKTAEGNENKCVAVTSCGEIRENQDVLGFLKDINMLLSTPSNNKNIHTVFKP